MTIKTKVGILIITASTMMILAAFAVSSGTGFALPEPFKLYSSALAQTVNPPPPEPLVLTDGQGEYPLGLHMEILEDPGGELTIEDVSSPAFTSQFIPSQVSVPNYGFTSSAYWVRFRLDNQTRLTTDWQLEQGFANTHYVDLYTALPGGGFAVKQTGVLRPVSTRDVLHPRFIFNLEIPPGSHQTYYLRFQNGASMTLALTLWAQAAFLKFAFVEHVFMGIFFGVLIGLLFYNLFLLFTLREANYLFFVLLIASLIFEEASYDGYLRAYIIPQLNFSVQYIEPVALPLLIGSMVLFTDSFLELKSRLPRLHTTSLVVLVVWGGLMLLIPFASYRLIANLMVPWSLISLSAILIAGIVAWKKGYRPSRFFLLAWLGLVISVFWVFLVRLGLASSSLLSENAFRLGYLWMAVCWSLALADRINLLKAESERANIALRSSEHRLSEILEGLPLGVVVYGKDQKPSYVNQRAVEILSDPDRGILPDISAGRSLAQAINYISLKVSGSDEIYPLENFPVFRALRGQLAIADDVEIDHGDTSVQLEIMASPVRDDSGNIESAVVAFRDITQRKQAESELAEYRKHLESLVRERTQELSDVNEQLHLHIDWLSAINQVNEIMARSADFTQIFENIIAIIDNLFATHGTFIVELDPELKQMKILAHSSRSDSPHDLVGTLTSLPEEIQANPDLEQTIPAYISKDQLAALNGPFGMHIQVSKIQGIFFVPLHLRDQILGFLGIEMPEGGMHIQSGESNLLSIFAIDIAQLIEDSHLYQQSKALIAAEERNRLARDLHDSVTQVLFSATLLADVLPQIWRRDPEQGLQKLEKLRRLTRGALAEMRTMLLELRPSAVIITPFGDLLAQLTEAVASRTGLPFQLYIEQIPSMRADVQTTYYRIAQEALNNVVKHAQARLVTVSLSATPLTTDPVAGVRQEVKLVIKDDGVGFSSGKRQSDHLGISIMRERAAAVQASLFVESQPGYGTQVTLIWGSETGA